MLNEKKILVAGAGGLLGANLIECLLKHQALVIAVDVNLQGMYTKLANHLNNPSLEVVELNLNEPEQVIAFFSNINTLNGAVNCTYPRNKNYGRHFLDVTYADFNENIALHLGSSFLLMQQCAKHFLRNKTPFSLVNIASVYGVIAPKFDIYHNTSMTMPIEYAAIKSALIHLNKYIANYIKDSNFRVNSVSPGGIWDNQPAPFVEKYKNHTLGKGMLDEKSISGTILFLLSDYSLHMNGQNLIVDDGFSL